MTFPEILNLNHQLGGDEEVSETSPTEPPPTAADKGEGDKNHTNDLSDEGEDRVEFDILCCVSNIIRIIRWSCA